MHWTIADLLSIWPFVTTSEIYIKTRIFHWKKWIWKHRLQIPIFCLGKNELALFLECSKPAAAPVIYQRDIEKVAIIIVIL